MSYNAGRGGHAPGYLRDTFLDWLDRGADEDTVFIDGDESRQKPLRWLFGQLWNCSDIVASHNRDALEQIGVPEESTWTYARAVRWLSTR